MALTDQDPLLRLRQAISSGQSFIPSASPDAGSAEVALAQASHLLFPDIDVAVPIDSATRFISNDKPVDLRSIYFAWLNRELAIPEYNASATTLNDELAAAGSAGKVQNLGFIERLDLITWLEGASEESEYIKPLAGDAAAASAPAAKAGVPSAAQARAGKGTIDPRLASIYDSERRMGDRNSVLRGIKATVSCDECLLDGVKRDVLLITVVGLFTRSKARRTIHPAQIPADSQPQRQHCAVS